MQSMCLRNNTGHDTVRMAENLVEPAGHCTNRLCLHLLLWTCSQTLLAGAADMFVTTRMICNDAMN